MKIFDKVKIELNDRIIKRYKFLGITFLKKEFSNTLHKYEVCGVSVYRKHLNDDGSSDKDKELDDWKTIYDSEYFDSDWYRNRYFWVERRRNDAALDCLRNGRTGLRNPGPEFYANEYLILNPDVKGAGMHPVLHYERFGKKEGRSISLAAVRKPVFPEGTVEIEEVFSNRLLNDKKVVSVIASYSGNGLIEEYVIQLVKGIRKVSDYIIFVADNPIYIKELEKIKDLVNACLFKRHSEYDFGSYKYGFQWLQEHGILENEDDLLFINDSNYGPVFPFSDVILKYRSANVDFYGLSISTFPRKHLQSFFLLFTCKVHQSKVFKNFIKSVKKELSAAYVVCNYEFWLTEILSGAGFTYDAYVPVDAFGKVEGRHIIPTKFTLTLLKEWKYPLVKIKALMGSSGEDVSDIEDYIKDNFPDFYRQISRHLSKKREKLNSNFSKKLSKYTLYQQYHQTEKRIRKKVTSGNKIKCVYLVNLIGMFAAENVMMEMLKDSSTFDVKLYAIPEIRFGDEEMLYELERTYQALREKYPFVKKAVDVKDGKIVQYNDVISDADIVCYPSPYNVSYSLYNPYYAAKNGILSIHINYGFFRSKYDRIIYRMDNYNNFWKVFLETEYNMNEYCQYGQCNGANAVLMGYAKMDKLAVYQKGVPSSRRKRIIIAPHHSVQGGMNNILALSNFERYADFFLAMPEKYPEIDFIFRPHPALFPVLTSEDKWGKERVKAYLDKIKSYSNVIYSDDGDYMQVFANSDAIIQDSGSFLVEYLYTGRPCCYLLKEESDIDEKFVELGKKCLECCYLSYSEEEITRFIEDVVICGQDKKKNTREIFSRNTLMLNYPSVSREIGNYIKNQFII